MSAVQLAVDFENAIYSLFDNTRQLSEAAQRPQFTSGVAAAFNAANIAVSSITLLAQAEAYFRGGGTAAELAPIMSRLSAAGLAMDAATSLVGIADLYHRSATDPSINQQRLIEKAIGKLLIQIAFAGLGFAWMGGIAGAALFFGLAGQFFDPDGLSDFLDFLQDLASPLSQLFRDPLVLDLDGDGIEVTPLDGSSVHFDYDGDGFAERTGWVAADDGMLAIDLNGNGMVDGAAELFGSPTQDGFAVLETLDSNGDGQIDAQDAAFAKLRVWRDLNQNGVSEAGELQTLAQAGIASISLARTDLSGTIDAWSLEVQRQHMHYRGVIH